MVPLTGRLLLVLLGLIALGMPALMAFQGGGSRGRDRARRLTLILVGQLAAVAVTAAAANDYGDFYPTWSDLFGTVHVAPDTPVESFGGTVAPPHRTAAAGTGARATTGETLPAAEAARIVGGLKRIAYASPDEYATRGAVVHLTGPDPSQEVLAYLPPSYFDGSVGNASLPVLELLTGYPGTPDTIVGKLHAPDDLLQGLKAGTLHPMVLLMTRPVNPFPRDTECSNVPNGPQNLDWFATTLPQLAATQLHITVTGLAAAGYSTGGYCALKLAMTKPEVFAGAASMSGYYHPLPGPGSGDLFGKDPHTRDLADLDWRLRNLPAPATAVMLATAKDERFDDGYDAAEEFLHLVHAPMSASAIVLPSGGHNFTTWDAELPRLLSFLDERLSRPTPR
jgi:hypothetical protein